MCLVRPDTNNSSRPLWRHERMPMINLNHYLIGIITCRVINVNKNFINQELYQYCLPYMPRRAAMKPALPARVTRAAMNAVDVRLAMVIFLWSRFPAMVVSRRSGNVRADRCGAMSPLRSFATTRGPPQRQAAPPSVTVGFQRWKSVKIKSLREKRRGPGADGSRPGSPVFLPCRTGRSSLRGKLGCAPQCVNYTNRYVAICPVWLFQMTKNWPTTKKAAPEGAAVQQGGSRAGQLGTKARQVKTGTNSLRLYCPFVPAARFFADPRSNYD